MGYKSTGLKELASRIAKLERQNRRWKWAAALFGLLATSLILMAAKPDDRIELPVVRARTVEARDFLLKDENVHVFARLSLSVERKCPNQLNVVRNSQAVLAFYDRVGKMVPSG